MNKIKKNINPNIGRQNKESKGDEDNSDCEEELKIAISELEVQSTENLKKTVKLILANKEIADQSVEIEKIVEELIILNEDLACQIKEKEKKATELSLANQELIKTEKEIRKINQELDCFIYSASHDLKHPIANIEGLLIAFSEHQCYLVAP